MTIALAVIAGILIGYGLTWLHVFLIWEIP
jgi:hypothetical protein